MRECVLCPGRSLGNADPPLFISPVVLEQEFISEVTDPYKATQFWPGAPGQMRQIEI